MTEIKIKITREVTQGVIDIKLYNIIIDPMDEESMIAVTSCDGRDILGFSDCQYDGIVTLLSGYYQKNDSFDHEKVQSVQFTYGRFKCAFDTLPNAHLATQKDFFNKLYEVKLWVDECKSRDKPKEEFFVHI